MSDSHSSPAVKPSKSSPDFPLFSHVGGQWAKKIPGRMHCFGAGSEIHRHIFRWLSPPPDNILDRGILTSRQRR